MSVASHRPRLHPEDVASGPVVDREWLIADRERRARRDRLDSKPVLGTRRRQNTPVEPENGDRGIDDDPMTLVHRRGRVELVGGLVQLRQGVGKPGEVGIRSFPADRLDCLDDRRVAVGCFDPVHRQFVRSRLAIRTFESYVDRLGRAGATGDYRLQCRQHRLAAGATDHRLQVLPDQLLARPVHSVVDRWRHVLDFPRRIDDEPNAP